MPVLQYLQMPIRRFMGPALIACLFLTYRSVTKDQLIVNLVDACDILPNSKKIKIFIHYLVS